MNRLRIVLDTNDLISAGLKPFGAQAQLVKLLALRNSIYASPIQFLQSTAKFSAVRSSPIFTPMCSGACWP